MSSWSCNKGCKNSSLSERQKFLQSNYYGVRKSTCNPNKPFSCNGVRPPIQFSTGSGYGNPLPMSGTDNWGATMAHPTMDNIYGSGISNNIYGVSTREGNCGGCDCPKECPVKEASWTDPDNNKIYTGQAAVMAYKAYHFKKYNDSGAPRGVRNTSGDTSFINSDLMFWNFGD